MRIPRDFQLTAFVSLSVKRSGRKREWDGLLPFMVLGLSIGIGMWISLRWLW